jgi:hypothetical protein
LSLKIQYTVYFTNCHKFHVAEVRALAIVKTHAAPAVDSRGEPRKVNKGAYMELQQFVKTLQTVLGVT